MKSLTLFAQQPVSLHGPFSLKHNTVLIPPYTNDAVKYGLTILENRRRRCLRMLTEIRFLFKLKDDGITREYNVGVD